MQLYNKYSTQLKGIYGQKVYKIPISIPCSCPNRDGNISTGGCIFCGENAVGYENLPTSISPKEQFSRNVEYISRKYKAKKFIPYFQNFTNTYLPLRDFKDYIEQVCQENVVGIAISTRPDCLREEYLVFLNDISKEFKLDITLELGLQTPNYHTLNKINRGHTLAEFIDGVLMAKKYNFDICAHVILNLPWDNDLDVVESAKILSALRVSSIKSHALYIEKHTKMADLYIKNEIEMISLEEYINRVIIFLEYLNPDISIQRLIGRAPKENTLFVNWSTSWWKIKDMIEEEMEIRQTYQGRKFNYLGGKAIETMQNS
ncbi:TIGR01212 family radical SAM protein [Alkalibaculum sp. M08DMB]|uniref:TIGR01212 family radical SAM protein n=1 Tax=Alkalibaculum sporogenes TaxID=2655001 RepID=A0A6A7K684_9FIRM|nr:TIGR01212 family radical SAM protein [Alkalibaculum sporogenes]MPW24851.1 TIGR01212 family radical SAM protein [Alkalibaculum sporogenes]